LSHSCNPSYAGGRDGEDHNLRTAQAKKSQDPISTTIKKLGMVRYTCHLSYLENMNKRIVVQVGSGIS
jgi:hypothetical protein